MELQADMAQFMEENQITDPTVMQYLFQALGYNQEAASSSTTDSKTKSSSGLASVLGF